MLCILLKGAMFKSSYETSRSCLTLGLSTRRRIWEENLCHSFLKVTLLWFHLPQHAHTRGKSIPINLCSIDCHHPHKLLFPCHVFTSIRLIMTNNAYLELLHPQVCTLEDCIGCVIAKYSTHRYLFLSNINIGTRLQGREVVNSKY